MTTESSFLGDVLNRLKAHKFADLRAIAEASGVPESTVRKLYYGEVQNPRVGTVELLHAYFIKEPANV